MKKLGNIIYTMRMSRGMHQQDLADALGVSQQAVASWENGTRVPSRSKIEALADVFNVPLSVFYVDDDADDPEFWALRDRLRRDENYRMLFSLTKHATTEDIQKIVKIYKTMKGIDD